MGGSTQNLRLLITSRKPFYGAPFPCKILAHEVPCLSSEDAAGLFLKRLHRPLYLRDFDAAAPEGPALGAGGWDSRSRRELLQQLAGHSLLAAVGGVPAAILRAAGEVTPQLPSLL